LSTGKWVELLLGVAALAVYLLSALASVESAGVERDVRRITVRPRRNGSKSRSDLSVEKKRFDLTSIPVLQTAALIVAVALLSSALFASRSSFQLALAAIVFAVICLLIPRFLLRPLSSSAKTGARLSIAVGFIGAIDDQISERVDRAFSPREETEESSIEGRTDPVSLESMNAEAENSFRSDKQSVESEMDLFFDLENLTVREIMVPRVDIVAVAVDDPFSDVLDTIIGAGHSRIPVFRDSIDQVEGILYAKDLLPYAAADETRPLIGELIRPALVVPESKRVTDLFRQMRRERVHISVVADEYGGTAGIVTIEDIIEEIVGEIRDEYDIEEPLLEVKNDAEVIADGRLPVGDAEELLGVSLVHADDDFETLGGFVHARLGRLPEEGDWFDVDGIHVEVLLVDRHRVRRVRLVREDPTENKPNASESPAPAIGSGAGRK
jgi:CBS domain containing-hemolysin-like protein